MQHGSPQSRQILFAVRVVPIGPKKKADSAKRGEILFASKAQPSLPPTVEVQHYGIDYAVDSSDLRFIPKDNDIHHCALTFLIAAYDEEDGSSALPLMGAKNYRRSRQLRLLASS